MQTLKILATRLNNSPVVRQGKSNWLQVYRNWKTWAKKQPNSEEYFQSLRSLTNDVVKGYYQNNFPSTRKHK